MMFQKAPYNRFEEFISAGADRFSLLCSLLEENGLKPLILNIAGKRHIALNCASRSVLLSAHYDRAANSPGANDNSAAVFMLVETTMELCAADSAPFVIFTDKEELSAGESIEEQGAYSLALYLREQGMGSSRIFCLDSCGAGDTLIISTAADHLLKREESFGASSVRCRVRKLRSTALEAARKAQIEKVLLLPTPFSDDAGFLKGGIAAQTITVLPETEAAAFASRVRTSPELVSCLVSGSAPSSGRRFIPETWRSLNGPGDSPLRLTTRYWKQVVRFVKALYAS